MKKKILFIMPGPMYEKESVKYQILSNYFDGSLITTSDREDIINSDKIYGFNLMCQKISKNNAIINNLRFILFALRHCLNIRKKKEDYHLVITYDPLKTGLIGVFCSIILHAKFAPEVNGVYTSPAVYMDIPNLMKKRIKQFIYPLIEAVVLFFADGVNILFPQQLEPFNKIVKNKTIHCFPCFVDTEQFVSSQSVMKKNVILFVGFPFKLKGVDILISAFKMVSQRFPDWQLKILGWYPDMRELNNHIEDHPKIFHHPAVLRKEMPEHIHSCSFFVLPSRSEAMGRVLVEAMSAGKPVIGANVEGIPNVVSDGVDGLLFESGDAIDLSKKMEILMVNTTLRDYLGKNGCKKALTKYNSKTYYKNLLNFYDEVINSKIHNFL